MELLTADKRKRDRIIWIYYRWDIDVWMHHRSSGPDENNPTEHFHEILDSYAIYSSKESDLQNRVLWKHPNGTYITNRDPWAQPDGFDYRAAFWDDDRLAKWGYFPTRSTSRVEGVHWMKSDIPVDSVLGPNRDNCATCDPSWRCDIRADAEEERKQKKKSQYNSLTRCSRHMM